MLIAKTNHHSIRCLLRMLIKRTSWRQLYMSNQGQRVSDQCTEHINKAQETVAMFHDLGTCRSDAFLARAGLDETFFTQAQVNVQDFFVNWDNVSPNLYDERINPNKRKGILNGISKDAAVVYRTYMRFGMQAQAEFEDNPAAKALASSIVEHGPELKRECVDELRHVRHLVTPYYRRP